MIYIHCDKIGQRRAIAICENLKCAHFGYDFQGEPICSYVPRKVQEIEWDRILRRAKEIEEEDGARQ